MSNGKFGDEGDNPVDNPSILNVERDDGLSPGLQPIVYNRSVPQLYITIYRKLFCCLLQNKALKFLNIL